MIDLEALFREMEKMLDFWHRRGDKLFPIATDLLPAHIRMVRANYHIWHCIEEYCEPDTNRVLYVYDQGLEHNKLRASARMEMDETFVKYQKKTIQIQPYNSETLASILDRWSNAHIKWMHLEDGPKKGSVKEDGRFLKQCAHQLFWDMTEGKRLIRVNTAESIKLEYPCERSKVCIGPEGVGDSSVPLQSK